MRTVAAKRPAKRRGVLDRRHVLRVAASLFRAQGYERTTLRDIARACDCLLGSLYYLFPSKEELLLAMMEQSIVEALARIDAAVEGVDDALERLRLASRAHVRQVVVENDMHFVLLFEWRSLGPEAKARTIALRDSYERRWETMLSDVAKAGYLSPKVDRHLLRLLGLGALNWIGTWYRPDGKYTPEEIADGLWETVAWEQKRR